LVDADDIQKLSKALRPELDEQEANAAVALLLKPEKEDVNVLLVKRGENPADPWSGQVALPGGKRDATDLNLKQTVIRETLEETKINLLVSCRFLGVLTALRSKPRRDLKILPFVILLEHEPAIRLNEKELEGFAWISLKEIMRGKGRVKLGLGEVPAYIVEGTVIWGLTYRALENFIRVLKLAGPSQ